MTSTAEALRNGDARLIDDPIDIPMKDPPWPPPSVHDQYVYTMMSLWMPVPLIFMAWYRISLMPVGIAVVIAWLLSCIVSPIHWSNYKMGGRLQMVDMLIASAVGLTLNVQIIVVGIEKVEHLAACIFMLVVMVGTTYVDMVKPHWDGNNGLILHLLLRFESMCFVIVHVLHGLCESKFYYACNATATSEGCNPTSSDRATFRWTSFMRSLVFIVVVILISFILLEDMVADKSCPAQL